METIQKKCRSEQWTVHTAQQHDAYIGTNAIDKYIDIANAVRNMFKVSCIHAATVVELSEKGHMNVGTTLYNSIDAVGTSAIDRGRMKQRDSTSSRHNKAHDHNSRL